MLAARTTAARSVARLTSRRFATAVDAAGVKVAAADNGEATASVTFLVKAGSRYESAPGAAHALQNFAFKSTGKRSALGTVRESELYGGVLSSSLSREYISLTAEFLRGDAPFFVDVLSSFIASAKYTPHEFLEYVSPVCTAESSALHSNPVARALELAHAAAFRTGLGAPLVQSSYESLSVESVRAHAAHAFAQGNIAVLGTGISSEELSKLIGASLSGLPPATASAPSASPSSYHGGETRVATAHGPQVAFVGYGVAGTPPSPALAVLAAHLSSTPSVKWGASLSPVPANAHAVYLPYSDAALLGFVVTGKDAQEVREAGKKAVGVLKAGVKGEEVQRAVAKAKFAAAAAVDGRSGLVATLGGKVLAGDAANIQSTISALEKVDASAVSAAVSALVKGKPTYVAVGDTQTLPYVDEIVA